MKTKNQKPTKKQESIKALREWLKPGDTVYTILRHVSSSGRSRRIDLYTIKKNQPVLLSWRAAEAMGYPINGDKPGIAVSGCGMDMGFHLVYNLGRTLFPKGFKVKVGRNGDGGYALKQRWM